MNNDRNREPSSPANDADIFEQGGLFVPKDKGGSSDLYEDLNSDPFKNPLLWDPNNPLKPL